MARKVFPLFGPSVPTMSIALGLLDASILTVPLSTASPALPVYFSPAVGNASCFNLPSGNFTPAISAEAGFQVPLRALPSSPARHHATVVIANKNASRRNVHRIINSMECRADEKSRYA